MCLGLGSIVKITVTCEAVCPNVNITVTGEALCINVNSNVTCVAV